SSRGNDGQVPWRTGSVSGRVSGRVTRQLTLPVRQNSRLPKGRWVLSHGRRKNASRVWAGEKMGKMGRLRPGNAKPQAARRLLEDLEETGPQRDGLTAGGAPVRLRVKGIVHEPTLLFVLH